MDKHRKSEVLGYRILLPASISNDEVNTANPAIASNIARVFDEDASFFFFIEPITSKFALRNCFQGEPWNEAIKHPGVICIVQTWLCPDINDF